MSVYREGRRIRDERGVGYSDLVSDADILAILRAEQGPAPEGERYRQFAYAVLGLRMHERDLAERGVTR